MSNTYDMKWAEYYVEGVSDGGEYKSYLLIQIDFSECKAARLTEDVEQKPDKVGSGINQISNMNDESVIQLDPAQAQQFVDELTALIDNGGIDKGSDPGDDYSLSRVTIYNSDNTEIYCAEWYIDNHTAWDTEHEALFGLLDQLFEDCYYG